ncbi:hypothetical protein XarbCFBP8153_05780 [Xanthomonas arboricola]|nr:hypothetical protein XarbCFBP8153_05780 [Xanthomonas arboricola]
MYLQRVPRWWAGKGPAARPQISRSRVGLALRSSYPQPRSPKTQAIAGRGSVPKRETLKAALSAWRCCQGSGCSVSRPVCGVWISGARSKPCSRACAR